jgi:2-polyprenyl-3-methyl-5-hydroxy-6-metoxy-1,4-benzoquinol methylase
MSMGLCAGGTASELSYGLVSGLNWLQSGYAATRAKATEELLRLWFLRRYRADPPVLRRMNEIMNLRPADIEQQVTATDPRSIPGNPEFVASGWSQHMLLRYLVALEDCNGARVLDSCCGLGWGSHLVASASADVTGVDLDAASVQFCARRWGRHNLRFQVANVLDLPFEDESFEVVLCMDAIEHFTRADGARYIRELARVCRRGGQLFGSSAFPETRWAADRLCQTNRHHYHIYTRREMVSLLRTSFGTPTWVTRHYFRATRA